MKIEAYKDGYGNIIIEEDSFEFLLACLDNQKFVGEVPPNGDAVESEYEQIQKDNQSTIDDINHQCRNILHQKIQVMIESKGLCLSKKYLEAEDFISWTSDELDLIKSEFKEFVIETPMWSDGDFITISNGDNKNREWSVEEINKVQEIIK